MKTTIIFGSSGLLGKEVVKTLIERGDKVVGVDISEDNECSTFFKKDLLQFESINDIFYFLEELNIQESNQLNIIDCSLIQSKAELNHKENIQSYWQGMLTMQILLVKAAYKFALKRNFKINIIFISSIKAFNPPKFWHYEGLGMDSNVEYAMAKAGLNILVKDTNVRYKGSIVCNAVAPGGIEGENHSNLFWERYSESCTNGGLVKPKGIAEVINLLTSDFNEISGQVIIVDNGWSLTWKISIQLIKMTI